MFEDAQGVENEVVDNEVLDGEKPEDIEEEITIGQPAAPAGEGEEEETPVIRKMRAELKEAGKAKREAERRLQEIEATKQPVVEPVPEILPDKTLADFDYDESQFIDHVNKRVDSKAKHSAYVLKQAQLVEDSKAAYQVRLNAYTEQKTALKVPKERMESAEESVASLLDVGKQNMILQSKIPAQLVYAIGNSPDHLARLAGITDRDQFLIELGQIQGQLVTTPRKAQAPTPERMLSKGGGTVSLSADAKKLEELSNDPSKFSEYRALKKRMEANK
jgi:hypothetical protein